MLIVHHSPYVSLTLGQHVYWSRWLAWWDDLCPELPSPSQAVVAVSVHNSLNPETEVSKDHPAKVLQEGKAKPHLECM